MSLCLIGLGANLGDPRSALARAVESISAVPRFTRIACSQFYETRPVGGPAGQPAYLNAAVTFDTQLAPADVLSQLQQIEQHAGRQRNERWGPRVLDLDLLLYADRVLASAALTVPHPRLAFRRFAVEPAAEIAPQMRHPQIGWTLAQLRDHLRNAVPYVAITGEPGVGKTWLARQLAARFSGQLIEDVSDPCVAASAGRDSSGRMEELEIEFVERRRDQLAQIDRENRSKLAISDFWIGQSLAYAGVSVPSAERDPADWPATVVRPKLLVVLDPDNAIRSETAGERPAVQRHLLGERLLGLARSAGVGPLLELTSPDATENLAEAIAAIEAMQSPPTGMDAAMFHP